MWFYQQNDTTLRRYWNYCCNKHEYRLFLSSLLNGSINDMKFMLFCRTRILLGKVLVPIDFRPFFKHRP